MLNFQNENKCQKQKPEKAPKYLNKKQRCGRRKQRRGFLTDMILSMPDETLSMKGLDTLAPKVISQASKEIDKTTEDRVRQVISDGRQQIHKIAPHIILGAIKDVHKTPFRLLENLGKKNLLNSREKLESSEQQK